MLTNHKAKHPKARPTRANLMCFIRPRFSAPQPLKHLVHPSTYLHYHSPPCPPVQRGRLPQDQPREHPREGISGNRCECDAALQSAPRRMPDPNPAETLVPALRPRSPLTCPRLQSRVRLESGGFFRRLRPCRQLLRVGGGRHLAEPLRRAFLAGLMPSGLRASPRAPAPPDETPSPPTSSKPSKPPDR